MIRLLVPGLLGPFPRRAEFPELPRLPALERLIARSDRRLGPTSYAEALFEHFGVTGQAPLPTAPVCHLADTQGQAESRYLLHADPVHLRPDQDRLLAFDFDSQALAQGGADPFVEAFNHHFADSGMELLAPHPSRWYLALNAAPHVRWHPLSEILGRNIDPFLPQGADGTHWRGLLNEVQMLFHSLPANPERESRGLLPISGLWFSGGGQLPGRVINRPRPALAIDGTTEVDCPLAAGLAALAPTAESDPLRIEHAAGRAVLDADVGAWLAALTALETCLPALMQGALRLDCCNGLSFYWSTGMRRRFWRRPRSVRPEQSG